MMLCGGAGFGAEAARERRDLRAGRTFIGGGGSIAPARLARLGFGAPHVSSRRPAGIARRGHTMEDAMSQFWTRTRTFLAVVWIATFVGEFLVYKLVQRTDNSWVLLLFLAVLVVPIVATDMTVRWVKRPRRERWARHDVAAAAQSPRVVVEPPTDPGPQSPPSAAL
jgi:hypothetical protein